MQTFLAKSSRNWLATMQNMAKFPLKIQLTILKRNEKFSFRLWKYSFTWTLNEYFNFIKRRVSLLFSKHNRCDEQTTNMDYVFVNLNAQGSVSFVSGLFLVKQFSRIRWQFWTMIYVLSWTLFFEIAHTQIIYGLTSFIETAKF